MTPAQPNGKSIHMKGCRTISTHQGLSWQACSPRAHGVLRRKRGAANARISQIWSRIGVGLFVIYTILSMRTPE
jgi:hypothetical protein